MEHDLHAEWRATRVINAIYQLLINQTFSSFTIGFVMLRAGLLKLRRRVTVSAWHLNYLTSIAVASSGKISTATWPTNQSNILWEQHYLIPRSLTKKNQSNLSLTFVTMLTHCLWMAMTGPESTAWWTWLLRNVKGAISLGPGHLCLHSS